MVTINRAVDHLIDVLAGEDVPVVGSKATRVDQLANMIADGEIVLGGGGYDLVIKTDKAIPEEVTSAELVSGSYEAATAKVLSGKPLTALVYGEEIFEGSSDRKVMTYGDTPVYFCDYVPEGADMILEVQIGLSQTALIIASDDSVTVSDE